MNISKHTTITQYIVYIAIILLSYLAIHSIAPKQNYIPKGIILPLAKPLPATNPTNIKFLAHMPANAKPLGRVNLLMHYHESQQYTEDMSVLYAKKLASSIGANALVIREAGFTIDKNTGLQSFVIESTAIKSETKNEH